MVSFAVEHTSKIFWSYGEAPKRRGTRGNLPLPPRRAWSPDVKNLHLKMAHISRTYVYVWLADWQLRPLTAHTGRSAVGQHA